MISGLTSSSRCRPVCVLISIYLKNSSKVSLDICYLLLFLLDNDVQTAAVLRVSGVRGDGGDKRAVTGDGTMCTEGAGLLV